MTQYFKEFYVAEETLSYLKAETSRRPKQRHPVTAHRGSRCFLMTPQQEQICSDWPQVQPISSQLCLTALIAPRTREKVEKYFMFKPP